MNDAGVQKGARSVKVVRNVPYLLDTLPELKGVPPGANFDTKLFNGYQRITSELRAADASISPDTQVPTGKAVQALKDLEAKYPEQSSAVKTIDKFRSMLEDRPSMSWEDFSAAKKAIFNEMKLSSIVGGEVYRVFKDVVRDVNPELADLNQKYYTVKSAIENADIHPEKGMRLNPKTTPKLQGYVGRDTPKKGFPLPL